MEARGSLTSVGIDWQRDLQREVSTRFFGDSDPVFRFSGERRSLGNAGTNV